MTRFQIGNLVRCINPVGQLEHNKLYEVEAVRESSIHDDFVILKEAPHGEYLSYRFELVNPSAEAQKIIDASNSFRIDLPEWAKETLVVTTIPGGGVGSSGEVKINSSASKNDSTKPDLSLIPRISNVEHAKAFMVGEKKYGRYNYCKGHKASQLIAAAKRHLDAWFEGEEHDPQDGQHHLGSVMACCSMILRQQELGTLKDDRYEAHKE